MRCSAMQIDADYIQVTRSCIQQRLCATQIRVGYSKKDKYWTFNQQLHFIYNFPRISYDHTRWQNI